MGFLVVLKSNILHLLASLEMSYEIGGIVPCHTLESTVCIMQELLLMTVS